MKQEYKTSDIARFYNLTHMAVFKWIKSGKLPVYETGGGHYRIMREDLIKFIKKTGKPCSKGPAHPNKDHEGAKDTSVGMALKKICCHERRKSCLNRVPHTEEDSIKIRETGGRE